MPKSKQKKQALIDFKNHVSSGKAAFFKKYRMDFVMGNREGVYLNDIDGKKKLLNLHSNGGVFNPGHRNPELIELLKNSFDELDIGNHHLMSRERANTAQLIASLMPGDLNYVVFGVSGGEAVDLAFKVARGFTGKTKIISATGGYHGHTGLALAAGDDKYYKPFGPPAPGFEQVEFGNIDQFEKSISEDTAAIILETIPATLGIVIPSQDYMQQVRQLCDKHGILLILDEVQSGLGRTGKLWAFENYDIIPDIVVLGKGLSGGIYPITATVFRTPLENVFHRDPFIHISTFGGAEPGCRIATRVLEISSSGEFLDHVNEMAAQIREGIEKLMEKHPGFLIELRQQGLMMGLKLKDEYSGPVLTKTAYDNGLLLIYANNDTSVCQFLPPLIITTDQIPEILTKLDKALSAARRLRPLVKMSKQIKKLVAPIKQLLQFNGN